LSLEQGEGGGVPGLRFPNDDEWPLSTRFPPHLLSPLMLGHIRNTEEISICSLPTFDLWKSNHGG
jgi:hypothetical protein